MASLILLSSICSPLLTLPSTLILSFVGYSSAACYTPEGLDRNAMLGASDGYLYAPCDNVAAVSMCCAIGPGRVADGTADNCIPGGLCYNVGANLYWRESCTDSTWKDPACIKLFVNGTGVNDVAITPCDNGSWCDGVGEGSVDCCKAGDGLFVVNGTETTQNPNSTTTSSSSMLSTSTTTATPTTSPFSSPSASAISTTTGPGGLSSGTKIGLGVGIGVGVSAVLAIIGFCLLARHSRRSRDAHTNYRPDAAGPWAVQQPELKVATEPDSHGMPPPLPELGDSVPKRKPVGGVTGTQSKNPAELES